MHTHILALLTASAATLALLTSAPAASAAGIWSDERPAAVTAALPITDTVDLTGSTPNPTDPTDCGAVDPGIGGTVWTRFELTDDTVLKVDAPGPMPLLAVYPAGSDTAVKCWFSWDTRYVTLPAGQYDVLVGVYDLGWTTSIPVEVSVVPAPANDNAADAAALDLPAFYAPMAMIAATREPGEQTPCQADTANRTVWYRFSAPASGWLSTSATLYPAWFALYTGTPGALAYTGQCGTDQWTTHVTPGATYYLQVAASNDSMLTGDYGITVQPAADLQVTFGVDPGDPSVYDDVTVNVSAAGLGMGPEPQGCSLNFGDGTATVNRDQCYGFTHRYAKDGTYTLTGTYTAAWGQTGTGTTSITVVTHDVAVSSLTAPKTANVGKAKTVTFNVATLTRFTEPVRADLYARTPTGDWTLIGTTSLTLTPAKKTIPVTFTWVATSADLVGPVTLKAEVTIVPHPDQWWWAPRDGRPSNNTALTAPIRVQH